MRLSRVSAALRREIRERARECCEYCLIAETETIFPHEPDHLIALKHGGRTVSQNLALACYDCNRFKGADIASIDVVTGALVGSFNPRTQRWSQHFRIEQGSIGPLTAMGRVTEALLRLNLPARVQIREQLAARGRYQLWPTAGSG